MSTTDKALRLFVFTLVAATAWAMLPVALLLQTDPLRILHSSVQRVWIFASQSFNPDSDVLNAMTGIEGAMAAIAVPLILNMLSNVSERYKSEMVSHYFRSQKTVTTFPAFLVFAIVVNIAMMLFDMASWPRLMTTALYALSTALFVVSICWFLRFLRLLQEYTDSRYLVERIHAKALETLQN